MAKNFASIWATQNDSVALEQRFFVKQEVTRGTMIAPTDTDLIHTLNGGGIKFKRPITTSPVRTGRHHTSVIESKDETTWSFPTFFHVNESLGSFATGEVDLAWRVLMRSLLGVETVGGSSLTFDASIAPSTTFSLFETGDLWSNQAPGCFVDASNWTFPGDGQSQAAWNGMGKTMYRIGIGKSVTANAANAITVATGEGLKFEVGGMVMVVKANGTTRSSDTPNGSPRTITAISGDVVTVDGAVLTDSDGTVTPVYLCYYEPTTPTAINHPLIGLVGAVSVGGITSGTCVRKVELNIQNNHEPHNFCWGERGLSGPLFTPGGRLTVQTTVEMSMSHDLLKFINNLKGFAGVALSMVVGSASGRRLAIALPKVPFEIPEISIPDTGSIPVTFSGTAEQSAEDAADEIQVQAL